MSDDDLRAREREVAGHPDAVTCTRLAFELTRAGRSDEGLRAALRALALDPSSRARELLRPGWGSARWGASRRGGRRESLKRAVAWPGLRTLRAPRALAGVPGSDLISGFEDLGGGVVAYTVEDGSLVAVDVFREQVLWRRERSHRIRMRDGGLLAECRSIDGTLTVETLDPITGQAHGRCVSTGLHAEDVHLIDDGRLLVLELLEGTTRAVPARPDHDAVSLVALSTFDLDTGERIARTELPPFRMVSEFHEVGKAILFGVLESQPGSLRGFDPAGREVYQLPCERLFESLDGRAVFLNPRSHMVFHDPETGDERTTVAPLDTGRSEPYALLATPTVIGFALSGLEVLDRRTLEHRWRDERELWWEEWHVAATRDAVLTISGDRATDLSLRSLDPETGRELSAVPVGPGTGPVAPMRMGLVGGRLILGATTPGTFELQVVEEA